MRGRWREKRRGGGRVNRCNIRYGEGEKKRNRKARANVELERSAAKSLLT